MTKLRCCDQLLEETDQSFVFGFVHVEFSTDISKHDTHICSKHKQALSLFFPLV